jgi:hypothetical protein
MVDVRWTDAWILAAIQWAGGGDLSHVIGAADAINHQIPMIDEVEHAVGLLVSAGLVKLSNDRFQPTREGEQLFQQADTADIFTTLNRIHAALRKVPVAKENASEWRIEPETFRSAYEEYMNRPG